MKPLPLHHEGRVFCTSDIPTQEQLASFICSEVTDMLKVWPKEATPPMVRVLFNPDTRCARLGKYAFISLSEV